MNAKQSFFSLKTLTMAITALFPLALGALSAILNYANYLYYLPVIFWMLFILAIIVLITFFTKKCIHQSIILVSIFIFTVASRLLFIVLLKTQPTSDFIYVLVNATNFLSPLYPDHYSINNPHWGIYNITISEIFRIFSDTLLTIQISNTILAGITAIGVYLLGKNIASSIRFGLISTILYLCWPADLLYKALPTGDHIFIAGLPYIFLIFSFVLKRGLEGNKSNRLILLSIGLLLGFIDLFKPVGIVVIIAVSIIIFTRSSKTAKSFIIASFSISVVILGFLITHTLGYSILHHRTGLQVPNNYYIRTLRIGLDVPNGGMWNQLTSEHILQVNLDNDESTAKAILLDETWSTISENKSSLTRFFYKKFDTVWKSDYDFYFWSAINRNAGYSSVINNFVSNQLMPFTDSYLVIILVLATIGAVYCALTPTKNPALSALTLFIFGFSLLLMLTEIQQRYRSILFSSLPVLSTYGILAFHRIVVLLQNKIKFFH